VLLVEPERHVRVRVEEEAIVGDQEIARDRSSSGIAIVVCVFSGMFARLLLPDPEV
jgi:hypothetical protein